jgi:hypothetical protein
MYFQTTARLANGDYLMHLAQFDNLAQSIEAAIRWSSPRKRGGYAIVRDPQGEKVFDSRESIK